jgi:hypothetical protein
MLPREIAARRLVNQRIATADCTRPLDVVAWLTAMQAQDYRGTLWSIGLRMRDATAAHIERAIADRSIVRTWPLRRTLHFVAAADVRWLLQLLAPRMIATGAGRLSRLELDAATMGRSRKALVNALQGGQCLTRPAMYEILDRAKISTAGQRGIHLIWRLAIDGVLCFARHEGKQPTFALLDEWIPSSRALDRDTALAELARRYFRSHGPATVHDFAWWSGLTVADAKIASEMVSAEFMRDGPYLFPSDPPATRPGLHLLPGFDEFLLGYKDRSASLAPAHARQIVPGGNGMFMPTIVADGRVIGTWKPASIGTPTRFRPFTARESRGYTAAATRYARFIAG